MHPAQAAGETAVLYIDDDAALGLLLRKSLKRRGLSVVCVADGAGGLAEIKDGHFSAIVLDHHLIGETGLDILPMIMAMPRHPPVVYITGSTDPAIAAEALRCGADDYVTKTVSQDFFDTLAHALDRVMRQSLSMEVPGKGDIPGHGPQ